MGLFSWLRRSGRRKDGDDPVRDTLISAVRRSDVDEVEAICRQHAGLIFKKFESWRTVPEDVRGDPEALNAYAGMLLMVAQLYESAGHPELIALLTGDPEENPIVQWQRDLPEARRLNDDGRFQESNALLHRILESMTGMSGSGVDNFRPKVYGLISLNTFRLGDLTESGRYLELALRECERTGDRDGVAVYSENLHSVLSADGGSGLGRVRNEVAVAQTLSDELRFKESNAALGEIMDRMDRDPAAQAYRTKVYGLLGSNFYRLDDLQRARKYTEQAVEESERVWDEDGIRIYRENLKVISAPPSTK